MMNKFFGVAEMPPWMSGLVEEICAWPNVVAESHEYGAIAFHLRNREIGHVHDYGAVELPFTVGIRDALIEAHLAERHEWVPESGWTTVRVAEHGLNTALQLLRFSYLLIQLRSVDHNAAAQAAQELTSSEFARLHKFVNGVA